MIGARFKSDAVHPRMRGEHRDVSDLGFSLTGSSPHARGTLTFPSMKLLIRAVHPRMRGEHKRLGIPMGAPYGSSPHARGTHADSGRFHELPRFIPACAGNTMFSGMTSPSRPVHPRMRGEHRCALLESIVLRGSSPHARGTPRCRCLDRSTWRFIPACAGNTSVSAPSATSHTGSSPHARGTHAEASWWRHSVRFIPACAGNTPAAIHRCAWKTVHPRMRGEHLASWACTSAANGSSPHARGTRPFITPANAIERFIPACAGNTTWPRAPPVPIAVHPRMRGEHTSSVKPIWSRVGSSPHARGTPGLKDSHLGDRRFIPACAGNTPEISTGHCITPVHPRMRGEHFLPLASGYTVIGSSPHARGTHCLSQSRQARRRFIPACAGNTLDAVHVAAHEAGSSPHARGTLSKRIGTHKWMRFIPACAGNTRQSAR